MHKIPKADYTDFGDETKMSNEQKEEMKRELWFNQFTQTLYNKGLISKEEKIELEKKIAM